MISSEASNALAHYNWPGNVRELANVMESVHVLARGSLIQTNDLPPRIQSSQAAAGVADGDLCLARLEKCAIEEALRRTNYCKAAASRLLGINIQRLARRMDKLSISRN